jgi:hypothetical protein
MKLRVLAVAALLPLALAQSGYPDSVTRLIPVERGKVVSISGTLESGIDMPDLSWAWRSDMACFVQTQAWKFQGKHKMFVIPTKLSGISEITVRVIPTDPNVNMSLWYYMAGATDYRVPPKVSNMRACEADFKWDRPFKNQTQDHTRWVSTGIKGNENVVIGVSAPKEVTAAEFKLEVSIK